MATSPRPGRPDRRQAGPSVPAPSNDCCARQALLIYGDSATQSQQEDDAVVVCGDEQDQGAVRREELTFWQSKIAACNGNLRKLRQTLQTVLGELARHDR